MTTIQIVVVAVRDGIDETSAGRGASLVVLSEFMGLKSALHVLGEAAGATSREAKTAGRQA